MHYQDNPYSIFRQFDFVKTVLAEKGEETLKNLFTGRDEAELVEQGSFRKRYFTPLVTLWLFVLQVLQADSSCRNVLCLWVAKLTLLKKPLCSLRTRAYVEARKRLKESGIQELALGLGNKLEALVESHWKGRDVKIVDGSGSSMPDTKSNQKAFGTQKSPKTEITFPLTRMVAVISLATGAILDFAFGPVKGRGTGEISLFRSLQANLKHGDILLFDRLYSTFIDMARLVRDGIDFVSLLHSERKLELNPIRPLRLGKQDWLYCFVRPALHHLRKYVYDQPYDTIPELVWVRVLTVHVARKGFRTRKLTIVTSLINPLEYTKEQLADLYRQRWQAELDLRSIKSVMKMDILRCKTPEMVRKEIWVHLLAYNLLRAVMLEVAGVHNILPRSISLQATRQLLSQLLGLLESSLEQSCEKLRLTLLIQLATEKVGQRPNRYEPRAVKRRPKNYPRLQKSRREARRELARNKA